MFCFVAFAVLAIMSIFSATHRKLAIEALDCVFRRITLRPCDTGFKEKMKSKIVAGLLLRSTFGARMFNRHFELFSWIFAILTIGSLYFAAVGGYNYYYYGSCNGLNAEGFCLFDPAGENNKISSPDGACLAELPLASDIHLENLNLGHYPNIQRGAENDIIVAACYGCDFSRKAYPTIKKLQQREDVNFTFVHFPTKDVTEFLNNYDFCIVDGYGDKFWEYNENLFTQDSEEIINEEYVREMVKDIGVDLDQLDICLNSAETTKLVDLQLSEIGSTGVYGTPTVEINGEIFVGPKPYRVYKQALK